MDSGKTSIIEGRHGTVIKEVMRDRMKKRGWDYMCLENIKAKYMSLDYSDENNDGME